MRSVPEQVLVCSGYVQRLLDSSINKSNLRITCKGIYDVTIWKCQKKDFASLQQGVVFVDHV